MEILTRPILQETEWTNLLEELGSEFAKRASEYDRSDVFVTENYEDLKKHHFLKAMIPVELGGGGISFSEMCNLLRQIAHYDSSTALALSMHNHLLSANIWKYKNGKGGEEILKKVADKQLILISTGANDWLESTGSMEKVEGGFLVTAQKDFASQSAVGDVLVTSAPFLDPAEGWQVLHFGVPMKSEGFSVLDNWYAMGMRGTGSHSVKLTRVFVPEAAMVLRRPRGKYHPVWNTVLTVALPLIMSVYVGIAEKAAQVALDQLKNKESQKPHIPFLIGEMDNELTTARILLKDMIHINNNFNFQATDENGQAMLCRKTVIAKACVQTVEKAMSAIGGQSYYRNQELERLFRDVQASAFHPLPEKIQQNFTGNYILQSGKI